MAHWVIGDIHGCHDTLLRLLDRIAFDPARDRLLLLGDLVNRGPRSLDVLRWARGHEDRVDTVLGNHDLHLLCLAHGIGAPKRRDTLDDILAAPDRHALLDWLRSRPLLLRRDRDVFVHAGLHPRWTVATAEAAARDAEAALRGPDLAGFLRAWRTSPVELNPAALDRPDPLLALHVLTRMRALAPDGALDFSWSGVPDPMPPGLAPWYRTPAPRGDTRVFFGHWAANDLMITPPAVCLDSGAVWGRRLTAFCLDSGAIVQAASVERGLAGD